MPCCQAFRDGFGEKCNTASSTSCFGYSFFLFSSLFSLILYQAVSSSMGVCVLVQIGTGAW